MCFSTTTTTTTTTTINNNNNYYIYYYLEWKCLYISVRLRQPSRANADLIYRSKWK
ncbi:hypothetical protein BCR32DRAFT_278119 [Anaeromyces robustus]|uniref:Uncharacterized protein n=1 Tax=Anaeromyces robustus TaxID=1754192 RepID=A0A1Y1XC83_9FUNG|nr:hypothetical protein BCR32DRAFT_278119 [Anaeromyces robustus]|eukprot:ORX83333.1 hypothetical protein BCR32DRAFT_278119 [Anaeromyces robustus]